MEYFSIFTLNDMNNVDVSLKDAFCAAVSFSMKYSCTHRDTSSVGFAASFSSRRSHFALPCNAVFTLPKVGVLPSVGRSILSKSGKFYFAFFLLCCIIKVIRMQDRNAVFG